MRRITISQYSSRICKLYVVVIALLHIGSVSHAADAHTPRKTKYVLFVMTDGLRWQEVFGGAEAMLLNSKITVKDVDAMTMAY